MSLRLLLVLVVFVLDAWAIERLWRPGRPRSGRLRWTAAIIAAPIFGAFWSRKHMRPLPPASTDPLPPPQPSDNPETHTSPEA